MTSKYMGKWYIRLLLAVGTGFLLTMFLGTMKTEVWELSPQPVSGIEANSAGTSEIVNGQYTANDIIIEGWGIINGIPSADVQNEVVAIDGEGNYFVLPQTATRNAVDVTAVIGDGQDYGQANFMAYCRYGMLPEGREYHLGILSTTAAGDAVFSETDVTLSDYGKARKGIEVSFYAVCMAVCTLLAWIGINCARNIAKTRAEQEIEWTATHMKKWSFFSVVTCWCWLCFSGGFCRRYSCLLALKQD